MYLDDGISRESAPITGDPGLGIDDEMAGNKYRQVSIEQVSAYKAPSIDKTRPVLTSTYYLLDRPPRSPLNTRSFSSPVP